MEIQTYLLPNTQEQLTDDKKKKPEGGGCQDIETLQK